MPDIQYQAKQMRKKWYNQRGSGERYFDWACKKLCETSLNKMKLRDGCRYQNGWIFGKVPKGGSNFQSKNLCCRFSTRLFQHEIWKLQHDFPKMRGWSRAIWNSSENSSVLVASPVPKTVNPCIWTFSNHFWHSANNCSDDEVALLQDPRHLQGALTRPPEQVVTQFVTETERK